MRRPPRLAVLIALLTPLALAAPAAADRVELDNGDRLDVDIVEANSEQITFDHPVLGRVTLPADRVTVLPPPPPPEETTTTDADQAAEQSAADQPATEAVEAAPPPAETADDPPELFGQPFLPGWDRRIELGLDGSEGNSETLNLRAAFMADYEDEQDRYHLGSAYHRKTTDGDKTENNFYAEGIRDWLLPDKKHFYFGQARYDYDDFEAWRQRFALAGGVGYQFVERDDFELIGRAGGGANYAWGGSADDELTPEALLGIEGNWTIKDGHAFEFKNTLYPDLGEPGQFRNLTSLGYVIELDRAKGLSMKFGLENEYESETDDNSEHNDLSYFASLVFDF